MGDRLGGVENLVRVGVADAAEKSRIGKRAFQSVILGGRVRLRNVSRSAPKTSMPPGSSRAKSFLTARRRAARRGACCPLPSGRAIRWGSRTPRDSGGPELGAGGRQCRRPAIMRCSTSQQIVFDADGNAFADSAQFADDAPFDGRERRLGGAQQERTRNADARERLSNHASTQRAKVGFDVGQFGHEYQLACRREDWQTSCRLSIPQCGIAESSQRGKIAVVQALRSAPLRNSSELWKTLWKTAPIVFLAPFFQ